MCQKESFKTIIPLEPTLEYPDDIYFLQGFDAEHFSHELEAVMFHEYMRRYRNDLGWLHMEHIKTKKPFPVTPENVGSVFPLETIPYPEDFVEYIFPILPSEAMRTSFPKRSEIPGRPFSPLFLSWMTRSLSISEIPTNT